MEEYKYLIGEIADMLGVSSDTLRHYEKKGILTARRASNGYRYYTKEDIPQMVSILYHRKMDIGLQDMEAIYSENGSVEKLTAITKERLAAETLAARQLQQNIKRLQLAQNDYEAIHHHLDDVMIKPFPASYIIIPQTGRAEAQNLWFQYAKKYSGLDMLYQFDEYRLDNTRHDFSPEYINTQLLLFQELKEYVECPFLQEEPPVTVPRPCVSVLHTASSHFPDEESIRTMITWADRQNIRLSHQLYCTCTFETLHDRRQTAYLQLFIPILTMSPSVI